MTIVPAILTSSMSLKLLPYLFTLSNRRVNEKTSTKDFSILYLEVNKIKGDMSGIQERLERKVDQQMMIPSATEDELNSLQRSKADRVELEELKMEFNRLDKVMAQLGQEYSEGDSYDEYDDEDSQVEDVISLGEPSVEEDADGDVFDEEDPSKKLADKAKQLTSKNLTQSTGFEQFKKVGENEEKPGQIKEDLDNIKQEGLVIRKNTDLSADMLGESAVDKALLVKGTNSSTKQID
jgi:hypothetical protein